MRNQSKTLGSIQESEQTGMENIDRAVRISFIYDARDIDLACP